MKKIFSTKTAQSLCHPDPRLAGLVSGSDPSAQVARCRNKFGMTCKTKGFTLAEVLITLGIIGVVASLTMPALITNYQNRIFETSKTVFESRMGEAMRQMNIAEELTGYTETDQFVGKLKKHMKIIKTCEPDKLNNCFVDKINSASGIPIEINGADFIGAPSDWGTKIHGIVLQNGHSAVIKYNPKCQSSGITATADDLEHCVAIAYDTNGKSLPNAQNKDIQGDALSLRMITLPGGLKMTEAEVAYGPVSEAPYNNNNNYWAGAHDICGKLGLRLPKGGITTGTYRCTDSGQTSEACQIHNWCETSGNACALDYWLAEEYSGKASGAYHLDTSVLARVINYYDKNGSGPKVRCVE